MKKWRVGYYAKFDIETSFGAIVGSSYFNNSASSISDTPHCSLWRLSAAFVF